MNEPIEIRVEKRLRHPRERVFDAFLNPARIGEWLFHTPAGMMERNDYDPVVGGSFAIFERRGEDLARHFGRFITIDRPDRIVFDFWVDEAGDEPTRVTVTLADEAGGCRIVLTHDLAAAWAAWADRTVAGWTMILDNLERVLETAR